MDPRLLEYYNRELQFVREVGAEFAQQYPRIAARLGMEGVDCADPYVERLLEGVALLAARVQLKIDARHPEFTQHLLEMIYPQLLCPVPSCAVAEFAPDFKEDLPKDGVRIPRESIVRTPLSKGERTACEFRLAHEVTLWPVRIAEVRYVSGSGALANMRVPDAAKYRAAIRIRLQTEGGARFAELGLDRLQFFIKASDDLAARLYEQVLANGQGVFATAPDGESGTSYPASAIVAGGLRDDEALLPATHRGFEGYRLLQEYFAFPDRYLFFSLAGFGGAVRACAGSTLDLYVLLDRVQPALENVLDSSHLRLFCAPIVNLFHKSLDRIHVGEHETEHHVLPDRNRPMDYEVYAIEQMTGIGEDGSAKVPILPFYAAGHRGPAVHESCYYTMQRRQRLYSTRQQRTGLRTHYIGTECFVSLVDGREAAIAPGFRQVDIQALCTNRDLPLQAAFGKGRTDLLLDGSAPVESIRCISGPTAPRPSPAFGDTSWKLISQLSLNYLSLSESDTSGAQLLRDILSLYAHAQDAVMARQLEGVRSVAYRTVVERIPSGGPISYGRGLRIAVTLDDVAFEGTGILVLATVLERFFARYVSINSFTRTELYSHSRGQIKQWPIRFGTRAVS